MSEKRKKNIQILILIFILLLLVLIYTKFFSPEKLKIASYNKKLLNIKKSNITSITITDKKESFLIEKKENTWFVKYKEKYFPALETKIKDYLDIIEKLPNGIIIDKGENPENYKKYGLDEERSLKVEIKTDKKSDYLIVGSVGSSPESSYIRYRDEKKVREVNSTIARETNNTASQWMNKKIFPDIKVEDVEKVEIESHNLSWFKGSYTLVKLPKTEEKDKKEEKKDETKDEFDIIPRPKGKLRDYHVKNMVTNIIFLYAYNYKIDGSIDKKEKLAEIKVYLNNGTKFTMSIYQKDKEDSADFIVAVDFNNYLYLVTEESLKYFIKSPQEMIVKD